MTGNEDDEYYPARVQNKFDNGNVEVKWEQWAADPETLPPDHIRTAKQLRKSCWPRVPSFVAQACRKTTEDIFEIRLQGQSKSIREALASSGIRMETLVKLKDDLSYVDQVLQDAGMKGDEHLGNRVAFLAALKDA